MLMLRFFMRHECAMNAPYHYLRPPCATVRTTRRLAGRFLAILLMAAPLLTVHIAHASADLCTIRYNDEMQRASPGGATIIAVPEFRLDCRGGIHASLTVGQTRSSTTQLQLEKRVDGTWIVVERGRTLSYPAQPGRYRILVAHTGETGSVSTWTLRYSRPLP